jgi:nucleoside phosphorylase
MQDWSALISAVKASERTTQYYVLSALYVLGAATQPVTATQVSELLNLQLRGKAPKQLPKLLRRYHSDVRVAAAGPSLQWMLTDSGVSKLRSLSGLTLSAHSGKDSFDFDVGVVCALEQPEFAAVIAATGGKTRWSELGDARYPHVYRKAEVQTDDGKVLRIVGTTSTSMGLTAASIVTTQLILQFRPRIVLMTGIAAGTRDGGKQFGDVLVADPSVDYNSGKVVQRDGIRGFQPDPYPIGLNPRLRSVLQKYRGQHSIFDDIRAGWKGPLPSGVNRLHVGPLGAADQVIDDASRVLEIQQNWRKLIGVEMETYGVYGACFESPDPKPRFLSCKSVCDFAAEKSDSWQEYAAYVAAQFAFRFLKAEWESLWPNA